MLSCRRWLGPSPGNRIAIRLDKTTDKYGSPSLEDIEAFARRFNAWMDESAAKGEAPEYYEYFDLP